MKLEEMAEVVAKDLFLQMQNDKEYDIETIDEQKKELLENTSPEYIKSAYKMLQKGMD